MSCLLIVIQIDDCVLCLQTCYRGHVESCINLINLVAYTQSCKLGSLGI
jgi:hypothetical protein